MSVRRGPANRRYYIRSIQDEKKRERRRESNARAMRALRARRRLKAAEEVVNPPFRLSIVKQIRQIRPLRRNAKINRYAKELKGTRIRKTEI